MPEGLHSERVCRNLIFWLFPSLVDIYTELLLNSSPIDELGHGACQSGWWFRSEQRALSHEPWAGHTGIHGNSASDSKPPTRLCHTDPVSGNTYQSYTYQIHQWGREGNGEKWNNWKKCCLKQTVPHTAETNNMCDSRNPVLKAYDSLTTADQHWLDFNLA